MQTIELGAEKRDLTTKGALHKIRQEGGIPVVVYGGKKEPAQLSVNGKELLRVLKGHGTNVLVNLKSGGAAEVVLLKELQRDTLTHDVIHVDFQRISMTEKLEVNVPLHLTGEAPGVKVGGGILEHMLREIRVRCLPADIPNAVDVNVSSLEVGGAVRVKDLPLPAGVSLVTDAEGLVCHVVAPAAEEAAPAAAAAEAGPAEPEVIAKGKKPEEGEEAAGGKAAPAAPAGKAPAGGKEKK